MAWGDTDPTEQIKKQIPSKQYPRYQSYERTNVQNGDKENEAVKNHEFRVGATEATSSIQSFSLPGLTWVDSPGLHSLNSENGKLAEDYRMHADLVLYTMKSDAPGRASDLDEIKALSKGGKKILLLLTGSDTSEPVKPIRMVNGRPVTAIVMKTPDTRKEQQNYVRKELQELPNIEKLKMVSISARYAQEHAHELDAFQDSGMETFFQTLQEICQSEGVKIKQSVPMTNLRNFLISCKDDSQPFLQLIEEFNPLLKKIESNLQKQIPIHIREGQNQIHRSVNQFFDDLENYRNDASHVNQELKKLGPKLAKDYAIIANEKLQSIADGLTKDFQSSVKSSIQDSTLADIPDFKLDTITEQVADGAQKGTKKRNAGLGSLLGGGLGLVLGGPLGMAIGAGLGGALGGASGDSASVSYKSIEITVGDNLHDIRQKILGSHTDAFEVALKNATNNLWKEFDESIQKLLNSLSIDLRNFGEHLNSILMETKKTI